MPEQRAPRAPAIVLDARRLLSANDGSVLAILDDDDQWRTPDGLATTSISYPVAAPAADVDPDELAAARAERREAWLTQALAIVADLACHADTITTDDVWLALTRADLPPADPRVDLSTLMGRARSAGLLEATQQTRPSARAANGGRRLRVWRCGGPARQAQLLAA